MGCQPPARGSSTCQSAGGPRSGERAVRADVGRWPQTARAGCGGRGGCALGRSPCGSQTRGAQHLPLDHRRLFWVLSWMCFTGILQDGKAAGRGSGHADCGREDRNRGCDATNTAPTEQSKLLPPESPHGAGLSGRSRDPWKGGSGAPQAGERRGRARRRGGRCGGHRCGQDPGEPGLLSPGL